MAGCVGGGGGGGDDRPPSCDAPVIECGAGEYHAREWLTPGSRDIASYTFDDPNAPQMGMVLTFESCATDTDPMHAPWEASVTISYRSDDGSVLSIGRTAADGTITTIDCDPGADFANRRFIRHPDGSTEETRWDESGEEVDPGAMMSALVCPSRALAPADGGAGGCEPDAG